MNNLNIQFNSLNYGTNLGTVEFISLAQVTLLISINFIDSTTHT